METIKIRIEKIKEFREVEITLPYYSKDLCHYFKVFSPEKAIMITDLSGHYSVDFVNVDLAFGSATETTESSRDEFNMAFESVIKIFCDKLESHE
jgi:hypothetical protein